MRPLPQPAAVVDDGRVNLSTLLDEAAASFSDRVALTLRGQPRTFADLTELSRGGARFLARSGARHVVYLAVSGPGYPVTMMSAARAGLPFIPVNYRLGVAQLEGLVTRFPDPIVVADPAWVNLVPGPNTVTVQEFCDQATAAGGTGDPLPDVDSAAVAVVLFTSGTTARPKAVLLRHSTLHAYVTRAVQALVVRPGDTSLVAVPPYHIMGVTGVLNNVCAGRRMVFLPTFSAPDWFELARAEQVTSASVVPTMMARLVRHLDGGPGDVPSLRALLYGGSRTPRSVLEQALRAFPETEFVHGYGLTETSAGVTALLPEEHRAALASDDPAVSARLGSAGRAVAGVDLQVRRSDGTVLGPGAVGELWVRGRQVSGEYAGAGSLLDADGWFPTRDQAHVDDDGYLFVHGRIDDTIIRGGENIAPAEIEDVLDAHPSVHAVAVIGLPDEEWGERIAAVVVARPGTTAAELTAFVRERLRGSRTPDEIIFRDELPYTDTGKIMRKALVARLRTP
jgi:acyl-CoA synthetase (AMP-forming)/AMP-acid ligase II